MGSEALPTLPKRKTHDKILPILKSLKDNSQSQDSASEEGRDIWGERYSLAPHRLASHGKEGREFWNSFLSASTYHPSFTQDLPPGKANKQAKHVERLSQGTRFLHQLFLSQYYGLTIPHFYCFSVSALRTFQRKFLSEHSSEAIKMFSTVIKWVF